MAAIRTSAGKPAQSAVPLNWWGRLHANIQKNPILAYILTFGYLGLVLFFIFTLNRNSTWFYAVNIIVFPLFVFSPFIILSMPFNGRVKIGLLLLLITVVMPIVGLFNTSYLELAIQISIFSGLALGLNIVVGFAGLLDLGHVAFFAVGAYLWGMFTSPAETVFTINSLSVGSNWFYLFIFFGVIAAAFVGMLIGLPVLRLRGDYLAIVTLGFGEVIRILARNADHPVNLTNGSQGLHDIGQPTVPEVLAPLIDNLSGLFGFNIANPNTAAGLMFFYALGIIILSMVILAARRLQESPIGRAWTAIREDEVAAVAMGVPLVRMKLMAFASGASFGGAIGVLFAAKQTFIDPNSFVLLSSISILAMVIVGGMGSIKGVVLGAAIVTLLDLHVLSNLSLQLNSLRNENFIVPLINFPIRDWPVQLEPAKYQPLVFGLILVLMMLFRPAGLLPEARRKLDLTKEDITDADIDAATPKAKPAAAGD